MGKTQLTGKNIKDGSLEVADLPDAIVRAWFYDSAFRYISITRDAAGVFTTASIEWPDLVTGTYAILARDAAGNVLSYSATRVVGGTTTTYTQPTMTRDGFGVTAQPSVLVT